MAKSTIHYCSNPKLHGQGYADGGRVMSDSKTTQENLQYPAVAAGRTSNSDGALAEDSGGYAEVAGTKDKNVYPADPAYVQGRIKATRKKM